MGTASDGDDEPIEIEPEPAGPEDLESEDKTAPAMPPEFRHSPLDQAAVDPGFEADVSLYEDEAAAQADARRRAALLLEATRLREQQPGADGAAESARAAFAADPSLLASFWPLRRLLAAG